MTTEELAASLLADFLAKERTKLDGPACPDGKHVPRVDDRGDWRRCDVCLRTIHRKGPDAPWVARCGSGCECRDCMARWSKPCSDPPRFEMDVVSVGSLVTMDADHRCGERGAMGGGATQGRWRVNGFWRQSRREDAGKYCMRYEGRSLVQCGPTEALYVSLYCVCGTMLRVDDFRAHATVTGHVDDHRG